MKVGFISGDWSNITDPDTGHPTPGGAGWYRLGMPAEFLSRHGIETVHCELVNIDRKRTDRGFWLNDFDGVEHQDCDIIVVQRWMDERAADAILHARKSGQVIINDIDDWYWGLHRKNAAYDASDPRKNPRMNRDHYLRAVHASDAVTVSTPFLRQKFIEQGMDTILIRNAIDLERWEWREPRDTPMPTIGWVGSTLYRSGDLETLTGVVSAACKRLGANFMHAGLFGGADHAGVALRLPEEILMARDGCSILEYPTLFRGIDIGIVPLNEVDFNRAKSAIKGMEYAASGIPFVAQGIDEYNWLREEVGIGNTARKPKQWINRLVALGDPEERIRQAKRDRDALQALDMERRWKDWLEVYESLT